MLVTASCTICVPHLENNSAVGVAIHKYDDILSVEVVLSWEIEEM
jgi:hypothetical protein